MPERIESFFGPYRFLSNFWESPFLLLVESADCEQPVFYTNYLFSPEVRESPGWRYFSCLEAAYQACKCAKLIDFEKFVAPLDAKSAKRLGKTVELRPWWEEEKLHVMEVLIKIKFSRSPESELLDATGDAVLIEGDTWGDTFWGVCNGVGENHLGRLLMDLRDMRRFHRARATNQS